jgi:hypothetical protein
VTGNGLAATAGGGRNDGSIPRDPAGPPYPRPRYLSLHIRPLGICSRFADRGLSVFVIEGLPRPHTHTGPQNFSPPQFRLRVVVFSTTPRGRQGAYRMPRRPRPAIRDLSRSRSR